MSQDQSKVKNIIYKNLSLIYLYLCLKMRKKMTRPLYKFLVVEFSNTKYTELS